jgi:hypothetical protein
VEALLKELEGKDISEVVAGGLSKLASVPSGGGGVASAPAAGKHPHCPFPTGMRGVWGEVRGQDGGGVASAPSADQHPSRHF